MYHNIYVCFSPKAEVAGGLGKELNHSDPNPTPLTVLRRLMHLDGSESSGGVDNNSLTRKKDLSEKDKLKTVLDNLIDEVCVIPIRMQYIFYVLI